MLGIIDVRVVQENPQRRVALLAVMTGPLAEFIDYIAESAEWNEDLVDFYVLHIAKDDELPHVDPSDPDSPVFDPEMVCTF